MTAAHLAPHAALLATLTVATALSLREGHRGRHRAGHGRTDDRHTTDRSNTVDRIPLDDLTSDQLDTLYDRAEGAEAARDRLFRSRDRQAARAERAKAELARYRTAWKSARHRAACYLQSNQNFAASLENDHAAYLQMAAEITRLTAGQCIHTRRMCDLHHAVPVADCPYPKCVAARTA